VDELIIFWTETSVKQRDSIFSYWNGRTESLDYSRKLNQAISIRLDHLKQHPEIGVKTNFKDHRMISLGHYSIFYRVVEPEIFITGFWDNRQNPEKLLSLLSDK
jgi:plasmid stabilization system protein ParE